METRSQPPGAWADRPAAPMARIGREVRSAFTATASGLLVPAGSTPPKPRAVDLFCGAGGISLGFLQAGWEVVGAMDNDPWACLTYLGNLGSWPMEGLHCLTEADASRLEKAIALSWQREEKKARAEGRLPRYALAGSTHFREVYDYPPVRHFWFGDVRQLTGTAMLTALGLEAGDLDAVVGGPPCQGFSRAGRRNVMDPRNSLVFEFARLVLELQPKVMMMENVPDLVTMVTPEGVPVLDAFSRILADGGFNTYEGVKRSLGLQAGRRAVIRQDARAPARAATARPGRWRRPVVPVASAQADLFEGESEQEG